MSDIVNQPPHYTKGGIECIDAIEAMLQGIQGTTEGFLAAQVLKYLWRHQLKGRPGEDLKKAQWYLARLVSRQPPSFTAEKTTAVTEFLLPRPTNPDSPAAKAWR